MASHQLLFLIYHQLDQILMFFAQGFKVLLLEIVIHRGLLLLDQAASLVHIYIWWESVVLSISLSSIGGANMDGIGLLLVIFCEKRRLLYVLSMPFKGMIEVRWMLIVFTIIRLIHRTMHLFLLLPLINVLFVIDQLPRQHELSWELV